MIIELFIPITLVVFFLFIVYRWEDPDELSRDLARRLQDMSRERQRQEDQTRKRISDHERTK